MTDIVQERYTGVVVGVNAVVPVLSNSVGGFLCKTSGTVTLTRGVNNILVVDAFPVTAGAYYPMPYHLNTGGGTFTAAGGASGTLGIG